MQGRLAAAVARVTAGVGVLAAALALAGCGGGSESGPSDMPATATTTTPITTTSTVELHHLTPAHNGALLAEGQAVIRSEADWHAFWSQHPDNTIPALRGVDFTRHMLLAVTGQDPGCGLQLAIQSVEVETRDPATHEPASWRVMFDQVPYLPPPMVACPQIASSVIDVVVWPRSDAPVRFVRTVARP